MTKLKNIVTDGQENPGIVVAYLAKQNGFTTNAFMPKGFLTISGPKPEYAEKYGFIEHASAKINDVIHANIQKSDAILRFGGNGNGRPEYNIMSNNIILYKKPHLSVSFLHTPFAGRSKAENAEAIADWITRFSIVNLYVTGTSEVYENGLMAETYEAMEQVFNLLKNA